MALGGLPGRIRSRLPTLAAVSLVAVSAAWPVSAGWAVTAGWPLSAAWAVTAVPRLATASADSSPAAAAPLACTVLPTPSSDSAGPGYDASVGNVDNGHTFCVRVGERLLVVLRAPAAGPDWSRPVVSRPGYLVAAPMTLMLVRGATGANFRAVKPGLVVVRSSRRVCAAKPGQVSCQAMQAWAIRLKITKK